MGWTAIAEWLLDEAWGYQDADENRENVIALAAMREHKHLGGSRQTGLPLSASAQDALDYIDVEIDNTELAGLTVQARVEVRTSNAATSVTPKIRNVTDATDAGTGVASTATDTDYSGANQVQTITITLAAGVKKYRLQLTAGNASNAVFGIGTIEIFATA